MTHYTQALAADLQLLNNWVDSIADFCGTDRGRRVKARLALDIEELTNTIVFELGPDGVCLVDGIPLPPATRRGAALAWFVLAAAQTRRGTLRAAWASETKRPGVGALAAIERAADDVERISPRLAAVMLGIGSQDGVLFIKNSVPGVRIICTSPTLARLCA